MELGTAKAELSYMSVVMVRTQRGLPRRRSRMVTSLPDSLGVGTHHLVTAKDNDFDVVLIDTAGRMQDNEVYVHALF